MCLLRLTWILSHCDIKDSPFWRPSWLPVSNGIVFASIGARLDLFEWYHIWRYLMTTIASGFNLKHWMEGDLLLPDLGIPSSCLFWAFDRGLHCSVRFNFLLFLCLQFWSWFDAWRGANGVDVRQARTLRKFLRRSFLGKCCYSQCLVLRRLWRSRNSGGQCCTVQPIVSSVEHFGTTWW